MRKGGGWKDGGLAGRLQRQQAEGHRRGPLHFREPATQQLRPQLLPAQAVERLALQVVGG